MEQHDGRGAMTVEKSRKKATPPVDICAILEACAKAGVAKLKYGDLEVVFAVPGQPVMAYDLPKTTFDGFAPQASGQELAVGDELATVNKDLLEDMRRSQLMIDDPASFEQEVIHNHLNGVAEHAATQN